MKVNLIKVDRIKENAITKLNSEEIFELIDHLVAYKEGSIYGKTLSRILKGNYNKA